MTGSLIATRFIADTPETATEYPAVGPNSADARFQAVYWRCIAVFFASSVRHNPHMRHVLFTNTTPPEVDGHSMAAFLAELGVETVPLDISYRLPNGAVRTWGNVFYILDIVAHFAAAPYADRLVVLDSDCLWIRPAAAMESSIDEHGMLTCTRPHGEAHVNSGLTRRDLKAFYEGFTDRPDDGVPLHLGGGVFAAHGRECARVMEVADRLWAHNLNEMSAGRNWLRTEEHLLSLACLHLGYAAGTANSFIDPIWTAFRHNTAAASDLDLAIWHLPAEKRTGFRRMFRDAVDRDSPFWRAPLGDEFRRYAAHKMGIPRRAPAKFALDLWAKLGERIG